MEKRTQKDQKKQQAAARAASDRASEHAEVENVLLVDAMMQHVADTTRSDALATRATGEEAHATSETTFAVAKAGKYQALVQK